MSGVKGKSGGSRKGSGRKVGVNTVPMTFRITKANAAVLDKQPNKSQFVNSAIQAAAVVGTDDKDQLIKGFGKWIFSHFEREVVTQRNKRSPETCA